MSVASVLATGLVIATALGSTGAQSQALALLRRPRLERVVLRARRAPAAPTAPSAAATPSAAVAPVAVKAALGAVATTTTPSTPTPATTTPASTPVPSQAKHVFIIALTTPSYRAAFGPRSTMSYLDRVLRPKGDLLSGYRSLGSTSLADYLAMISGQGPNFDTARDCTTYAEFPARAAPDKSGEVPGRGCVYPNTVITIGDQLDVAARGWKGYFEDLGRATSPPQPSCQHPNSGGLDATLTPAAGSDYATTQNPFVYFHSLLDLGDCTKDDLPLTALTGGLRSARRTASLVYIAPGVCDDGSATPCPGVTPAGAAGADAFLKRWVPVVLGSPGYRKNGVLIIVFASARTHVTGRVARARPLRTGALVISRYARAGSTAQVPYTPYSVLRSVEDLFAVKALGHARAARSFATTALPGARPHTG